MSTYETDQREAVVTRRFLTARTVELASTIPLATTLVTAVGRERDVSVFNLSEARLGAKPHKAQLAVANFFKAAETYARATAELKSAYYAAYEHTERYYCGSDSDGNARYCTRTYWDEERNVPKHGIVFSWDNTASDYNDKVKYLTSHPLVDSEKLQNVMIEAQEGNTTAQKVIASLLYTGEIALLLGYEELLVKIGSSRHRRSFREEYHSHTNRQHSRRSVAKVVAALSGAFVAHKMGKGLDEKLAKGEAVLVNELDQAMLMTNRNREVTPTQFFGKSINQIRSNVLNHVAQAEHSLRLGVRAHRPKSAFTSLASQGKNFVATANAVLASEDAMTFMGEISLCGSITKKLEGASNAQERAASLGVSLEALTMLGVLTAMLGPAEYFIQKNP